MMVSHFNGDWKVDRHHELFMTRFSHSKTVVIFCLQFPYNDVDSPCLIVLGKIGFMETLVEVNESTAEATLNVSLTLNSSIQFEIMFSLFANTMNGSTAMGNATCSIVIYVQ